MARARRVAAVAAQFADDVDRAGRFPAEAIAAAKARGADGRDGADEPRRRGREPRRGRRHLLHARPRLRLDRDDLRHAPGEGRLRGPPRHRQRLACRAFLRTLADEQLLLASSTTEGGGGGNVRSSEAPVEHDGSRIALERDATVISYGAQADAIVTTARRAPTPRRRTRCSSCFWQGRLHAGADAVLGHARHARHLQRRLHPARRGRCRAGPAEPYERIHAQTMVPAAHILWSSAWAGIAAGAVERARTFVRKAARGGGELPPSAPLLTPRATASLRALRALIVADGRPLRERSPTTPTALSTHRVPDRDQPAEGRGLGAGGADRDERDARLRPVGYRNDSDFSIGRHLRDMLSSPIMINNDRILANVADRRAAERGRRPR